MPVHGIRLGDSGPRVGRQGHRRRDIRHDAEVEHEEVGGDLPDPLFRKMHPVLRLALAAGGLCMMSPGTLTDFVGLAVVAGVCGFEYFSAKKARG